jgi:hypothetical protein
MGDGIKVGLNGVVFVLLLQDKAEVAAVLTLINRFPGRVGNLLTSCETASSHEVVLSWGLFVTYLLTY